MKRFFQTRIQLIIIGFIVLGGPIPPVLGEPLFQADTTRVVFVGDSITGQGGGWMKTGFVFQIENALQAVYPNKQHELIALGGSGSGVQGWIGFERKSREGEAEVFLDVKKHGLKKNLGKPADVLVVMLGMNDVLAPYVGADDASLMKWKENYVSLVEALCLRVTPKTVALATISMATEDLNSPKNILIGRMNKILAKVAEERGFLLLPVSEVLWDVHQRGRKLDPRFHTTTDFVHPNAGGHIGVAMGMLKGFGETEAVNFLEQGPLQKVWQAAKKRGKLTVTKPVATPWLLAAKVHQPFWEGNVFQPEKARTVIDKAIEKGADFTGPLKLKNGQQLVWKKYIPSVNYTGEDSSGSVDFAAITHARAFEGGYGVQWIRSAAATSARLELDSKMSAGTNHLSVWLNGERLFEGMLEKGKLPTSVDAQLRAGWNTLAFKANHRTWQWQFSVNIVSSRDGKPLRGLEYSTSPQSVESR